jgi:hypothetical protein
MPLPKQSPIRSLVRNRFLWVLLLLLIGGAIAHVYVSYTNRVTVTVHNATLDYLEDVRVYDESGRGLVLAELGEWSSQDFVFTGVTEQKVVTVRYTRKGMKSSEVTSTYTLQKGERTTVNLVDGSSLEEGIELNVPLYFNTKKESHDL